MLRMTPSEQLFPQRPGMSRAEISYLSKLRRSGSCLEDAELGQCMVDYTD